MESNAEFYQRLQRGPSILFLGQNYLKMESEEDAFLKDILNRFEYKYDKASTYKDIFLTSANTDVETALSWMSHRANNILVPEWLKHVAQFPWNGLYTSAIDNLFKKAFQSKWREFHPITDTNYYPSDIRSKQKLHTTYLFGNVNKSVENERPPLNKFEFNNKLRNMANSLAKRLPEIVTHFGILLIEGYNIEDDWFAIEDFSAILNEFNEGQVHLFNARKINKNNEFLQYLIKSNKIELHEESLATCLRNGKKQGFLEINSAEQVEIGDKTILLGNKVYAIPPSIWIAGTKVGFVLDDKMMVEEKVDSQETLYYKFKTFLEESSNKPLWEGFKNNFNFCRNFENKLFDIVIKKLKEKRMYKIAPILVSGQTGTGKTVGLTALAYKIKKMNIYPVLFIPRNHNKPDFEDIDKFCKWAEEKSNVNTLIIWDCMSDYDQYLYLLQFLNSRGRKVVLVGSSYQLNEENDDKKKISPNNLITVEPNLKGQEIANFKKLLDRFNIIAQKDIEKYFDEHILVALYRLLPDTRTYIRNGLKFELDYAKETINSDYILKREKEIENLISGTLGYSMVQSGLITFEELKHKFKNDIAKDNDQESEALHDAIGYIMVPGQFGLKVPIELVFRCINRLDYLKVIDLFKKHDIFNIGEDRNGNITIGARHSLEAKLICRAQLDGPKNEIDFIQKLIFNIKEPVNDYENSEINFCIELLKFIGANGNDVQRFFPFYKSISFVLKELRLNRSFQNPFLMLAEGNFIREYTRQNTEELDFESAEKEIFINNEIEILTIARDMLEKKMRNKYRSKLGYIYIELASALGWLIGINIKKQDNISAADNFIILKDCLEKAHLYGQEERAIDILGWTVRDMIKSNLFNQIEISKYEREFTFTLERAEMEGLSIANSERIQRRKYQIGDSLNNNSMISDALENLEKLGSLGYYLKARSILGNIDLKKITKRNHIELKVIKDAFTFLEANRMQINNDGYSLYLLFHLWWLSKMKQTMFYKEREHFNFTIDDWKYLLKLLIDIKKCGEKFISPVLLYFLAISHFHLLDFAEAFQIFNDINRDYYINHSRRIFSSYLASIPDGSGLPWKFNGQAKEPIDNERGYIYIDEIRRKTKFTPKLFNKDIKAGETLADFHIGFNFIGLTIEPDKETEKEEGKRLGKKDGKRKY